MMTDDILLPPVDRAVRVLLVEDDAGDAYLTQRQLESVRTARYEIVWAKTVEEGLDRLADASLDACIVDYCLGASNGLEFIRLARAKRVSVPLIMLTGSASQDIDFEAMQLGVADYLCKTDMSAALLERSIRYAIERKRSEQALVVEARRDPLTGLHNRISLNERLELALQRQSRSDKGLALILIDLDGFKAINDTLGHQAGDELLVILADRLKQTVRPYDLVARLGGDEFVILVEDLDADDTIHEHRACGDTNAIQGLANRVFAAICEPACVDGMPINVSASLGIARCPADSTTAEQLLHRADEAMYQAKRSKRRPATVYDPTICGDQPCISPCSVRRAMLADRFHVAYQPQVDLISGEIRGAEALIRWTLVDGRSVAPGDFIPMCEQSGLIYDVGHWVRRTAVAQSAAWRAQAVMAGPISVNVSAAELSHPDLLPSLEALLEQYPGPIEVELTESAIVADLSQARSVLRRLQKSGIRIAIDDFGTGYSALEHLRELPCDTLKIDRSFVAAIDAPGAGTAIIEAIVALARGIGARLIAEGIETEDQRQRLVDLGVEIGQGFGLCRPLPAETFERWGEGHSRI